MKKIVSLFLAVFLCGIVATSCELKEILEDLEGPKDKWCETKLSYTTDGENPQTSELYCYLYYTEKGVEAGTKGYKTGITLQPGLTIVVTASSTNNAANVIGENKYVMKTLKNGRSYNLEGTETDGKFTVNSTLWTLICNLVDREIPASASSQVCDPLNGDTKYAEYTELTELGDFNWKKVLAQILIDKLLE